MYRNLLSITYYKFENGKPKLLKNFYIYKVTKEKQNVEELFKFFEEKLKELIDINEREIDMKIVGREENTWIDEDEAQFDFKRIGFKENDIVFQVVSKEGVLKKVIL